MKGKKGNKRLDNQRKNTDRLQSNLRISSEYDTSFLALSPWAYTLPKIITLAGLRSLCSVMGFLMPSECK